MSCIHPFYIPSSDNNDIVVIHHATIFITILCEATVSLIVWIPTAKPWEGHISPWSWPKLGPQINRPFWTLDYFGSESFVVSWFFYTFTGPHIGANYVQIYIASRVETLGLSAVYTLFTVTFANRWFGCVRFEASRFMMLGSGDHKLIVIHGDHYDTKQTDRLDLSCKVLR